MGSVCCCLLGSQEEEGHHHHHHQTVNGSNNLIHMMNRFGFILDDDNDETIANLQPGSAIRPSSIDPDHGLPNLQHNGGLASSAPERSAANPQQNVEPSKKINNCNNEDKKLKSKETSCVVNLQERQSESSAASEIESRVLHQYSAADVEDVCPTCLEEYTPENPKIVAECNHEFHLACIFEWMKRSECCPVCGKLMMFDETK